MVVRPEAGQVLGWTILLLRDAARTRPGLTPTGRGTAPGERRKPPAPTATPAAYRVLGERDCHAARSASPRRRHGRWSTSAPAPGSPAAGPDRWTVRIGSWRPPRGTIGRPARRSRSGPGSRRPRPG